MPSAVATPSISAWIASFRDGILPPPIHGREIPSTQGPRPIPSCRRAQAVRIENCSRASLPYRCRRQLQPLPSARGSPRSGTVFCLPQFMEERFHPRKDLVQSHHVGELKRSVLKIVAELHCRIDAVGSCNPFHQRVDRLVQGRYFASPNSWKRDSIHARTSSNPIM